ncbi:MULTISPECIES: DNA-3-methyladenine glycosylase [unclassified Pseudomonas]|uniref:DNA-3-methyladenine glycosylase family protein n=1 Tax=unclassified Pseudomonas TaxID=196821 RepID=UPI000BC80967|nr:MULTISPECIES: AlkA N-terminal domain-containing protein [unclassified Pseudomonas]PVZ19660.1 DNA-3-methyladenine glycosylase II [Pseudomonas sp. URIL14HWK12:I12]PVZ22755.1 DNA-3-methyladenine glycosylase II [Pseudomonas sp. URIL14HWK12:I10]PVZ37615.1 DNA-3-methyladenine glycosylase II [Pseudomonas sp. URIL14HWK12:I11]SNZ15255.1 DNA-3-methyladenine glycosylase II [Pseudomonas sp. URIL14HWK12:I9]
MKIVAGVAQQDCELPYTPPLDWPRLIRFLHGRATAGVELASLADGYWRNLLWEGLPGQFQVTPLATGRLLLRAYGPAAAHLDSWLPRAAGLFDLQADPAPINAHLGQDPWLGPLSRLAPGLRVAGAWSAFELLVRAVVGQQVSVKAATTLMGRLVERAAGAVPGVVNRALSAVCPEPQALATANLDHIGMPGRRVAALQGVAAQVALGNLPLERGAAPLPDQRAALLALPGIGPWTVEYVAMRAWGDSDAWPGTDLILLQQIQRQHPELLKPAQWRGRSEAWRPWRAYAALHVWNAVADAAGGARGG